MGLSVILVWFMTLCLVADSAPTQGLSSLRFDDATAHLSRRGIFKWNAADYQVSLHHSQVQPMQPELIDIINTAVSLIRLVATSWSKNPAMTPFGGKSVVDERNSGVSIYVTVDDSTKDYSTQLLGFVGIAAMHWLLQESEHCFVPCLIGHDLDYFLWNSDVRSGQILFQSNVLGSKTTRTPSYRNESIISSNLTQPALGGAIPSTPELETNDFELVNFTRHSIEIAGSIPISTWIGLVFKALLQGIWTKHKSLSSINYSGVWKSQVIQLSSHEGLTLSFELLKAVQNGHRFNFGDLVQTLMSLISDARVFPPLRSANLFTMVTEDEDPKPLPPFLKIFIHSEGVSTDGLNSDVNSAGYNELEGGSNLTEVPEVVSNVTGNSSASIRLS